MSCRFDKEKSEKIADEILGMEFEIKRRGEGNKIDCYGVVLYYFKKFGINLPEYIYADDWGENANLVLKEYASLARKLDKEERPEIGDIIVFINKYDSASHLGVYIGEGRFVHSYMKIGTRIDSLTDPDWKKKIYGIFRLKEKDS